ncbi:aminotransferase class I/II-fold pyridoxal phosphate-dependent enzyme [Gemmatimonadales bacterium]|nr:aminotransferase class I/II-fold pyridoxal phosphate-dependent enzyme [Gemmatimonadales bacterium]
MTDSLSSRGARAAASPLRIDYDALRETERDRYHPTENAQGKIPLNIAKNRLSWPDLRAKIESIASSESIPDWVPSYTAAGGAPAFRKALAHFMGTHLTGCSIEPDEVVVSPGATGVIEMTAFVLAEEGDVAVIPAPCYPVYTKDLGNFSQIERYDLVTHHEISEIADGPLLTVDDLERAWKDITDSGRRFRLLILTSPDNPTGGIYSVERLNRIADWCIAHHVHLIVNEIYGLSIIDTAHPDISDDYVAKVEFSSFGQVMKARQSEYLHLWYSLSKDLGISGFRVGILWTLNKRALEAYENLNLTHSLSNYTQWVLSRVLTEDEFIHDFITRNQQRLTDSYALAARSFRAMGVPYVPARGSLFLWVDLSEFLGEDSESGEMRLWREIFDDTGVLLTPGVGFGHSKHGLFRFVYPCVQYDELEVAMVRLASYADKRRPG